MTTNTTAVWRKSTFSGDQGDCVEVRSDGDVIAVRDSKDPQGPILRFTRSELAAWIDGCRAGEFDDLI